MQQDEVGLLYEVDLPDTQAARDLVTSIKRGDVSQSSFAFTVEKDDWQEDDEGRVIRTIEKFKRLYDVSPVTYPAYPDASVGLRSLEAWQKNRTEAREAEVAATAAAERTKREAAHARRARFLRLLPPDSSQYPPIRSPRKRAFLCPVPPIRGQERAFNPVRPGSAEDRPMSKLKELKTDRERIAKQMRDMHEKAEKEERAFTSADDEAWNNLDTELQNVDAKIKRAERLEDLGTATAGDLRAAGRDGGQNRPKARRTKRPRSAPSCAVAWPN